MEKSVREKGKKVVSGLLENLRIKRKKLERGSRMKNRRTANPKKNRAGRGAGRQDHLGGARKRN